MEDSELEDERDVWVENSFGNQRFISWKRLWHFIGPGFLVSIAYIDPGNIGADLEAGSRFKYSLIWVLVLASFLGLILQNLASRLGIVTGKNLAQQCRAEYSRRLSIVLWIIAEITVIASDIPEVIGSAIALNLLFGTPLWLGVIVASISVLLFLAINYFGIRKLEACIAFLIGIILLCYILELFLSEVPISGIMSGFIPSIPSGSVYSITSLVGAVVMPHNLFLHSALVLSRKINRDVHDIKEACWYNMFESTLALIISMTINISVISVAAKDFYPSENIGLSSAPALLDSVLGGRRLAATLFAISLLASGQSSTMTGTFAGQFVMEGFLNFQVSHWQRSLFTRGLAIFPSLLVALIAGENGADRLILLSQVLLSILLPFSLIPLVKFTSSSRKMGPFCSSKRTRFFLSFLGAGVTLANLSMAWDSISPIFSSISKSSATFLFLLFSVLVLCYLSFLGYLIWLPLSETSVYFNLQDEIELDSSMKSLGNVLPSNELFNARRLV